MKKVHDDWKLRSNVRPVVVLNRVNPNERNSTRYFREVGYSSLNNANQDFNSEDILEELHKIISVCDPRCELCCKFVHQLSDHIVKIHSQGQGVKTSIRNKRKQKFENVDNSISDYSLELTQNPTGTYDTEFKVQEKLLQNERRTKRTRKSTKVKELEEIEIKQEEEEGTLPDNSVSSTYDDPDLCPESISDCEFKYENDAGVANVKTEEKMGKIHETDNNEVKLFRRKRQKIMRIKHSTKRLRFCCKSCPKIFSLKRLLDVHRMSRHKESDLKKCAECMRKFSSEQKYENHFRLAHPGKYPYTCQIQTCGKGFRKPFNLTVHIAAIHNSPRAEADVNVDEGFCACTCEFCEESFANKSDLNTHVLNEHTLKTHYTCKKCSQGFLDAEDLSRHFKTHFASVAENDPDKFLCYTCAICDEAFSSSTKLLGHVREAHRLGRNYSCHICTCVDRELKFGYQDLIDHFESSHPSQLPFACKVCKLTFKRYHALVIHERIVHTKKQVFPCGQCSYISESRIKLIRHQSGPRHKNISKEIVEESANAGSSENFDNEGQDLDEDEDYENPPKSYAFACGICTQTYDESGQLIHHIKRLHKEFLSLNFSSYVCSQKFHNVVQLNFHVRKSHPKDLPFGCVICHKGFNNMPQLRRHSKTHTGEKSNICAICGKGNATPSLLKLHEISHELLIEKPYKCNEPECDKSYATKKGLELHQVLHTSSKKPKVKVKATEFLCFICGISFKHSSTLRGHLRVHSKPPRVKKTYVCAVEGCGKVYKQTSHFKDHQLTHSGEKPYACDWDGCTWKFKRLESLKHHRRVHTGEKPYKCDKCDRAFGKRYRLKDHVKKTH